MGKLSKTFGAVVLGAVCLAGTVGCSKAPEAKLPAPAVSVVPVEAVATAKEDPATTPLDPVLKGFWLSYSEVDKRADINYDRNLQAADGKPIYTVTLNYPKAAIPEASPDDYGSMQLRNKALLDFMGACMGSDNAKAVTQMSEGIIQVITTPLKMRDTIEITHVTPGQKGYTTDAVLGCSDRESPAKITAAITKLKADNGFNP